MPAQCTRCGYLNVFGDLPGGPRPIKSIVVTENGDLRSAFVPIYPADVEALDAKSREAVIVYLNDPRQMTKQQRDLLGYLRSKDTSLLAAKAKKIGMMASLVDFLKKYKPIT